MEPVLPVDSFPWRLRLKHLGRAALSVERQGRRLVFDPVTPPEHGELIVLTGDPSDGLAGTIAAVEGDRRPEVVGSQEVLHWLGQRGELTGQLPPIQVDGLSFSVEPYTPQFRATPGETLRTAWSGLLRPDRTAARLRRGLARPGGPHLVVQVALPGGERLVHLGSALGSRLPADALDRLVQRFAGAEWLIAGAAHGEQDTIATQIPAFGAAVVLVTDLFNEARRERGQPTELLTPLVDRLCAQGIPAHPFSPGASYRFE